MKTFHKSCCCCCDLIDFHCMSVWNIQNDSREFLQMIGRPWDHYTKNLCNKKATKQSYLHFSNEQTIIIMSERWRYPYCPRCDNAYYIDADYGPYGTCNTCGILRVKLTQKQMEDHNKSYDEGLTFSKKFSQDCIDREATKQESYRRMSEMGMFGRTAPTEELQKKFVDLINHTHHRWLGLLW